MDAVVNTNVTKLSTILAGVSFDMEPRYLTDYSSQIRTQIEKAVKELKDKLENGGYSDDYYPVQDVIAEYVRVGYIINSHHGEGLFSEGDMIEGIPVKLDRSSLRSMAVCVDDVEFESESEEDDDGEIHSVTKTSYFRENLSESVTW